MKSIRALLVCLSFGISSVSAQEVRDESHIKVLTDMNQLEKRFAKLIVPEILKLYKARGTELSAKEEKFFPDMMVREFRYGDTLKLSEEDLAKFNTSGKVKSFKVSEAYWKILATKAQPDDRQGAQILAVYKGIQKVNEDSRVIDQLLVVRMHQQMEDQKKGMLRVKNMRKLQNYCRTLNRASLAEVQKEKAPAMMKFSDVDGKKLDWLFKKHTNDKGYIIYSPVAVHGFYIVNFEGDAIKKVTPEQAKAEFGIGR